ncbi:MAG: L-threonylcarbamoyladenylate synthase [Oscillospiraceae bacterium]|nr:L-threonylcarbamoyladenylate synthase [Oscillospiraceae bacterium]
MKTTVITGDDLSYAVEVFLSGGLVAVPTDTVYGLAGNGLDVDAVAKIYEVKGRPEVKPLILLVPDIHAVEAVSAEIPETARILSDAFWPGALTLVLPRRDTVPDIVTAGGDTVGVRCPGHPKALEFLRLAGVPAAAPSANISDMPSPKSAEDVLAYFDGKIDCVVDGGECKYGVESTIVSLVDGTYKIIRQGALPEKEIRRVLADIASR